MFSVGSRISDCSVLVTRQIVSAYQICEQFETSKNSEIADSINAPRGPRGPRLGCDIKIIIECRGNRSLRNN